MVTAPERFLVDREGLDDLIRTLRDLGYAVIGPAVRQEAIVHAEIESIGDLPAGWTDAQDGGTYRLQRRDDDALFGFAVGPHSWKSFLFPPDTLLWRGRRTDDGFEIEEEPAERPRYAFLGVRSCDLAAVGVQDKVFMAEGASDPTYAALREQAFIVAVNCGSPAGTCFCVSMGTGPRASKGYDLALTELLDAERHDFLVEVGTARGREVLDAIPHRVAATTDEAAAEAVVEDAAARMGRQMDVTGIKELLYRNQEHPRWDDVAQRCLTCGNCTMVCPTCFCATVEDTTDLTGEVAERHRLWDSCFTLDHSYLAGGSVRASTRSRYRQWLTHKLATWIDQFETSGCVGCGRCITWCPVAIDITEEVRAIREDDGAI